MQGKKKAIARPKRGALHGDRPALTETKRPVLRLHISKQMPVDIRRRGSGGKEGLEEGPEGTEGTEEGPEARGMRGLQVVRWIPVWVKDHDDVGRREIQPEPARLRLCASAPL